MTLFEKAVALMADKPASLSTGDIAKAINVSRAWVGMFARNEIPNPGVHTVQKLVDFLEGQSK